MTKYIVPMTVCVSVTVDAPTKSAALLEARRVAEEGLTVSADFVAGWNSVSVPAGFPPVVEFSGIDIETIYPEEIERAED